MKIINQIFNQSKKSISREILYPFLFVLIGMLQFFYNSSAEAQSIDQGIARLQFIHSRLRLIHGSFSEEYPEQLMVAMYLDPDARVLELGGNVGRNSCVIGALLNDSRNLVVIEPCEAYTRLLQQNRNVNDLGFHIEASAVSKVPLIQLEWVTVPSEIDRPGWTRVKTLTFDELQIKYGIVFDTLVVDCEGALYYILKDDPDLLRNIKTIIIENDFDSLEQMIEVQDLFRNNGLQCVFNGPYTDGWRACGSYFFQVWQK